MACDRRNSYFSFWAILFPFNPLTAQTMKISKKQKKILDISSFYTSAPKIMIICYNVPEIWHVMDVIIFHFGQFFAHPPNIPKKSLKNLKNTLEISSFNTSVPKTMSICFTVPEIYCVTDLIVIFHFELNFFPFTSLRPRLDAKFLPCQIQLNS